MRTLEMQYPELKLNLTWYAVILHCRAANVQPIYIYLNRLSTSRDYPVEDTIEENKSQGERTSVYRGKETFTGKRFKLVSFYDLFWTFWSQTYLKKIANRLFVYVTPDSLRKYRAKIENWDIPAHTHNGQ